MKKIDMFTESFKMKYEAFFTGCDALEEMGAWDKEKLGEMELFYTNDMVGIIIRLIASDGRISQKEADYLNKTFGFDYSVAELVEIYENCAGDIGHAFDENFENGITYMRKINSKLADAYKELLGLVCAIIIASDGVVAEAEMEQVRRLKGMCD